MTTACPANRTARRSQPRNAARIGHGVVARLVLAASTLFTVALAGCSSDAVTQKLPIGAKCIASAECGTVPIFHCDSALPEGYCTKGCLSDGDCPEGAVCLVGDGYNLCKKTCTPSLGCARSGYTCRPKSASTETFPFASDNYCDAPAGDGGVITPSDSGTTPGDGGTLPGDGGGTPSDGGM